MTETDNDSGAKRSAPPRYDNTLAPAFTAVPDKALPLEVHRAPFPRSLLPRLQRAWSSKPNNRSTYLPTRGLRELVECVGSGVLAVGSDLEADTWLHAVRPPENELPLQLALEAWITTEVAPHQSDVDWFSLVKAAFPLEWSPTTLDLLAHGKAPNGTARPRAHVYQLLASYLATQWIDNKWTLPGQKQDEAAILGPIGERGERSVYLGPPRELTDEDGAYGLWTHQTKFRVRTMPHDDRLIIRVTPHITRFGGTTPVYIPRRSPDKPASATVLLHVPGGVLSGIERAQFLRAPVLVTGRADAMNWSWMPGISRVVPSLPTPHLYPDPNAVRANPRAHNGLGRDERHEKDPVALLLHSTGYTYLLDAPDAEAGRKADGHPAETGLQPIDHLLLFEQLKVVLPGLHLEPVVPIAKIPQRRAPRLEAAAPGAMYRLELGHTAPRTYEAVHLALTGLLGYTHAAKRTEAGREVHTYRGDTEIQLSLFNPGTLVSGMPWPTESTREERAETRRRHREERTWALREALPDDGQLTGSLIEIGKPVSFNAAHQDDPKPLLKKALPPLGRHVQCLHPVTRTATPDAKKDAAKPFQNSQIRRDDVERAASAVRDILRSVGHLPKLPRPRNVAGPFELTAMHLARARGGLVPLLLRATTEGDVTAQLAPSSSHPHEAPMPLVDLPHALVEGRGRVRARDRAPLADFLTHALALDSSADRLLVVRTQTLRNSEIWPWLQNDLISPDALVPPGVDCSSVDPTARRTPATLPGLRIVRINDDSDEIPLVFGMNPLDDPETETDGDELPYEWGRYSGLIPWNDRTYLAVNPRPDTHQLGKSVSKYFGNDRDITRHGANPTSLEIHVSFKQPADKAVDLAAYVNGLRRCHLHTKAPTRLPYLLHLARLMEEYIE
ncbi:RNaseH domain-containing protein [Streptomyces sp. NPDC041068]|uniref:RNaseH domain-containing protein n=1 Tax=Streptomyces sp. NPDC041068 TaxID=3155130 RepID=UPI00340044CE